VTDPLRAADEIVPDEIMAAIGTPQTRTTASGDRWPRQVLTGTQDDRLPMSSSLELKPLRVAAAVFAIAIIVGIIIALAMTAVLVAGEFLVTGPSAPAAARADAPGPGWHEDTDSAVAHHHHR